MQATLTAQAALTGVERFQGLMGTVGALTPRVCQQHSTRPSR